LFVGELTCRRAPAGVTLRFYQDDEARRRSGSKPHKRILPYFSSVSFDQAALRALLAERNVKHVTRARCARSLRSHRVNLFRPCRFPALNGGATGA